MPTSNLQWGFFSSCAYFGSIWILLWGSLSLNGACAVVCHAAVSCWEHSEGPPLASYSGETNSVKSFSEAWLPCSPLSTCRKRTFIHLFSPEYPFFLYVTPLQMNIFGQKENGATGQPCTICPWPPHSSTAVQSVVLHALCPLHLFFPLLIYGKQRPPAHEVTPNLALWSLFAPPKDLSSPQSAPMVRSPVTCSSLLPKGLSPLWRNEAFAMHNLAFMSVCVTPDSKSLSLSAKQKLSGRHFACCYGRFTPKGTFLTLVPAIGVFLIQTQWGLR